LWSKRIFKRAEVAYGTELIYRDGILEVGGLAIDRLVREEKLAQAEHELVEARLAAERIRALADQQATRKQQEVMSAVQAEAEQIKAAAQAEAAGIREAARRAGQEEGVALAQKELSAKLAVAMQSVESTIDAALKEKEQLILNSEPEIIRLAVEVASKIVNETVKVDSEIIVRTIRQALERTHDQGSIQIFISPGDLALLETELGEYFTELKGAGHTVMADPAIGAGGCRLETDYGTIDATIATQLEVLREKMLQAPNGDSDASAEPE